MSWNLLAVTSGSLLPRRSCTIFFFFLSKLIFKPDQQLEWWKWKVLFYLAHRSSTDGRITVESFVTRSEILLQEWKRAEDRREKWEEKRSDELEITSVSGSLLLDSYGFSETYKARLQPAMYAYYTKKIEIDLHEDEKCSHHSQVSYLCACSLLCAEDTSNKPTAAYHNRLHVDPPVRKRLQT